MTLCFMEAQPHNSFSRVPFVSEPKILFEDQHLIVVEKPAGYLSQEDGSDAPCLVSWLRAHVGRNYVGVVHRLDRNTSGLMVYAKRSKAAARLTESLQDGTLHRRYQALLWGVGLPQTFEWRDRLFKDEKTNVARVVSPNSNHRDAKEAVLTGKVLEQKSTATLCEFELQTGRSHQIRVQCSSRKFPLVGDQKYDSSFQSRAVKFSRPALHSCYLSFPHPMRSEEILRFNSPLPNDMDVLWKKL